MSLKNTSQSRISKTCWGGVKKKLAKENGLICHTRRFDGSGRIVLRQYRDNIIPLIIRIASVPISLQDKFEM